MMMRKWNDQDRLAIKLFQKILNGRFSSKKISPPVRGHTFSRIVSSILFLFSKHNIFHKSDLPRQSCSDNNEKWKETTFNKTFFANFLYRCNTFKCRIKWSLREIFFNTLIECLWSSWTRQRRKWHDTCLNRKSQNKKKAQKTWIDWSWEYNQTTKIFFMCLCFIVVFT